jgi:hypothetical protein
MPPRSPPPTASRSVMAPAPPRPQLPTPRRAGARLVSCPRSGISAEVVVESRPGLGCACRRLAAGPRPRSGPSAWWTRSQLLSYFVTVTANFSGLAEIDGAGCRRADHLDQGDRGVYRGTRSSSRTGDCTRRAPDVARAADTASSCAARGKRVRRRSRTRRCRHHRVPVVHEDRRLSGLGCNAIDTPPTSHRSRSAKSGRQMSACSAACTPPATPPASTPPPITRRCTVYRARVS